MYQLMVISKKASAVAADNTTFLESFTVFGSAADD